MRKIIALILVIVGIWAIDEKPWRQEEPTTADNTTTYGYNTGYNYYGGYDYDYDWDNDYDDTYTMKCTWCRGSGDCKDCGGDGKSRLKGVLASFGCTLASPPAIATSAGEAAIRSNVDPAFHSQQKQLKAGRILESGCALIR